MRKLGIIALFVLSSFIANAEEIKGKFHLVKSNTTTDLRGDQCSETVNLYFNNIEQIFKMEGVFGTFYNTWATNTKKCQRNGYHFVAPQTCNILKSFDNEIYIQEKEQILRGAFQSDWKAYLYIKFSDNYRSFYVETRYPGVRAQSKTVKCFYRL